MIEVYAFEGCYDLDYIIIPESVTSIGEDAFFACKSFTVYCVKDSVADKYEKYPEGSKKIYITIPIKGDADNSGVIDATDAALVLQKVLTGDKMAIEDVVENYMKYVDVDNDGQLTSKDASYILQKALDSTFLMPNEK